MAEPIIYTVGGTVQANERGIYLHRQADTELLQLCRDAKFAYILTPRQMGKSSLMIRTAEQLIEEGTQSVIIDLTQIGTQLTAEAWYSDFLDLVASQLLLHTNVKQWWQAHAQSGLTLRLTRFFQEVVLAEVLGQIVIFVDEIDTTLSLDFTDDFYAAIRYIYVARANHPEFRRLSFVLIGVATPGDLIRNPQRTPFNIGQRVDLLDFTFKEALPLAPGLGLSVDHSINMLQQILHWTGGHPYLTQKLCRLIRTAQPERPIDVVSTWLEEQVQVHIINHWEFQDEPPHLRTIRDLLLADEQIAGRLLGLYQQVLQQGAMPATASPEEIKLRLTGLVIERQGQLVVRSPIYATIFDQAWVEAALANLRPYAETISTWLASESKNNASLLRGQKLQEALVWAAGKSLPDHDREFLLASQRLENQVMEAENRMLAEAKQKITWRLSVATISMGAAIASAVGAAVWASRAVSQAQAQAQKEQATAKAAIQTAQTATQVAGSAVIARSRAHREAQELQRNVELGQKELARTRQQITKSEQKAREAAERTSRTLEIQQQIQTTLKLQTIALANTNADLGQKKRNIRDVWDFGQALAESFQGQNEKALSILQQVLDNNPQNTFAWLGRGYIYQQMQRTREAEAAFRQALKTDRGDPIVWLSLGNVLYKQQKLDEAVAAYRQAIAISPTDAQIYINLGIALKAQQKLDEAVAAYRQAIAIKPTDAQAYYNLGNALQKQQKLDEAVVAYRQAIAISPTDAQTFTNLGTALYKQQKLDEAVAAYRQAIAISPTDAQVYINLGIALKAQQKLDEAVAAYRQAIAISSTDARAYINLGIALKAQQKLDEAVAAYRQAIAISPTDSDALIQLGDTYLRLGQYEEALKQTDRALTAGPNTFVFVVRGMVYLQTQKLELALNNFNQGLHNNHKNDWTFYQRALAYRLLNQPSKCQTDLITAIQLAKENSIDRHSQPMDYWRNLLNLAIYQLAAGEVEQADQLYQQAIRDRSSQLIIPEAIYDLTIFLKLFPAHTQATSTRESLKKALGK